MSEVDRQLAEQAGYYRERAGEYEDWWFRRGRYDRGPAPNERWFADAVEVQRALERFRPEGEVLELACGTGLWTELLASRAASVTAVDGSPEMLELCRARVNHPRVSYVQADIFEWRPERTYDVCFFGFWLSHVPEERFEVFWQKVKQALRPGGRVFFVAACAAISPPLPTTSSPTPPIKPCSAGSPTGASTASSSASTNPLSYSSNSQNSAGRLRFTEQPASLSMGMGDSQPMF